MIAIAIATLPYRPTAKAIMLESSHRMCRLPVHEGRRRDAERRVQLDAVLRTEHTNKGEMVYGMADGKHYFPRCAGWHSKLTNLSIAKLVQHVAVLIQN